MGDQIVARYGLHDQMDPAIQHYEEKVISWYKEQRKNDKMNGINCYKSLSGWPITKAQLCEGEAARSSQSAMISPVSFSMF